VGPANLSGNLDPAAQNRIDGDGHVIVRCKVYGNFDDFRIEGAMGRDTGNQIAGEVFGSGFNGDVIVLTRVFQ
jgi:ribosomal protein S28E/S33